MYQIKHSPVKTEPRHITVSMGLSGMDHVSDSIVIMLLFSWSTSDVYSCIYTNSQKNKYAREFKKQIF